MNNYDEMSVEERAKAMESDFQRALEQKEGNPGYGLDGVVPPKTGFGLTDEDVREQSQPELSTVAGIEATNGISTERQEYMDQRAMAPIVDAPVQYDYERETSRMEKANNLLDSVQHKEYIADREERYAALDREKEQIQNDLISRNLDAFENIKEQVQSGSGFTNEQPVSNNEETKMDYTKFQKQSTKVEDRSLDPNLVEKIKTAGKAALIAFMLAGAIKLTADIVKEPELPVQDPVQIEQEMQERQAEEQRIQELREQALQSEPDYNTYYDKDGNLIVYDNNNQEERKKVVSIQSNEQDYQEDVTKGVRN